MVLASYQESFSSRKIKTKKFTLQKMLWKRFRFLPIAAFVTNDVIVTLDMISNDVKIRTSWAAHLGGAFAGWVRCNHDITRFYIYFKTDIWFGCAQKLSIEAVGGMLDTDNGRPFLSDTWCNCNLECFLPRRFVQQRIWWSQRAGILGRAVWKSWNFLLRMWHGRDKYCTSIFLSDPKKDLNQTEINQKIYETVQDTVLAGFDANWTVM